MFKTLLTIIILILWGWTQSMGQESNTSTGDTFGAENICPGNWSLSNLAGWAVRNEEGIILPLTVDTKVFGCDGKQIQLDSELAGTSVGIKCTPSSVKNGLPNISTITIWCR